VQGLHEIGRNVEKMDLHMFRKDINTMKIEIEKLFAFR